MMDVSLARVRNLMCVSGPVPSPNWKTLPSQDVTFRFPALTVSLMNLRKMTFIASART